MFFVLSRAWYKEKKSESPWGIKPQTSDALNALPLSYRDSTVSEVYYEVHTISVLHTAKINNVDSISIMYVIMFSIMFINRMREIVTFELGKEIEKDIFVLSRAWDKENILSRILTQNFFFVSRSWQDEKHLSLFLYWAQTSPSLLICLYPSLLSFMYWYVE